MAPGAPAQIESRMRPHLFLERTPWSQRKPYTGGTAKKSALAARATGRRGTSPLPTVVPSRPGPLACVAIGAATFWGACTPALEVEVSGCSGWRGAEVCELGAGTAV